MRRSRTLVFPIAVAVLAGCSSGASDTGTGAAFPDDPFVAPDELPPDHVCTRFGGQSEGYCFDVSKVCSSPGSCDGSAGHEFTHTTYDTGLVTLDYFFVEVLTQMADSLPCDECDSVPASMSIGLGFEIKAAAPHTIKSILYLTALSVVDTDDLYVLDDESAASIQLTQASPNLAVGRGFALLEEYNGPRDIELEFSFKLENTDE